MHRLAAPAVVFYSAYLAGILDVRRPPGIAASGERGGPRSSGPEGRKARILVVDDYPDTAESFGVLLRGWGFVVRVAHDGPAALAIADEFLPNVVLLDIGLPAMSGFEVAEEIRRRPGLEGVVLIAQTGFGRQEDRDVAEQAGFDHYFLKPVDLTLLKSFLGSI